MLKQLSLLLFFSLVYTNAYSVECPASIPGQTFQHQAAGAPWLMDVNYISQGWTVVQDPLLENSSIATISQNAVVKVIYMKASVDVNSYSVSCEYSISSTYSPVHLIVTNINPFPAPNNPNFTRVSDDTFICKTSADNTAKCRDDTVRQIVCGLGQSC
jgi:hypothetical protein